MEIKSDYLKLKCRKCGRKILVEFGLIGTPHHVALSVTCAECVTVGDDYRQQFPDRARDIEDWIKEP